MPTVCPFVSITNRRSAAGIQMCVWLRRMSSRSPWAKCNFDVAHSRVDEGKGKTFSAFSIKRSVVGKRVLKTTVRCVEDNNSRLRLQLTRRWVKIGRLSSHYAPRASSRPSINSLSGSHGAELRTRETDRRSTLWASPPPHRWTTLYHGYARSSASVRSRMLVFPSERTSRQHPCRGWSYQVSKTAEIILF